MIYSDDLAYVHHVGFGDYARRAAPELARMLARLAPFRSGRSDRSLVVEIGCGGGTTAAYLTNHGFRVLGVDQSPAMVKLARKTAPAARFELGSLARTPIPRCGAIVALGEVFNYIIATRGGVRAHDRPTVPVLRPRRHRAGARRAPALRLHGVCQRADV